MSERPCITWNNNFCQRHPLCLNENSKSEIFYLLIYFLNTCKSQGWVRPNQGLRPQSGTFKWKIDTLLLEPSPVAFQCAHQQKLGHGLEPGIRNRALGYGIWISQAMCLESLHQSSSPDHLCALKWIVRSL